MSNLSKHEFVALDISRKNYLSWVLDADIHLAAKGLGDTIAQVKDPLELWSGLKERYDHLKATILPKVRYEWMHLRLQDFKTQYREKGFKKYSELIPCLLGAEQHNTLLLKNHETRPTVSASLPEANMVERCKKSEKRQNNYHRHINVRGHGNGKRRYNNRHRGGHGKRENNIDSQNNPSRGKNSNYHRCDMKVHWKIECRAPEYFARLYQTSIKRKANNIGAFSPNAPVEYHLTFKNYFEAGPSNKNDGNAEGNLALNDNNFEGLDDLTHLEVEHFFGDQN
ncbi:uncharacterized protein LOC107768190 [Nicotiana tabacum]|uniref:Uncharacterized protein LOC107768190 n=1 Tax=Nicotiana tabacum TaxID=4097 RepID=A0A1S3XS52_TOBAC|nr:PREDICTED: uncharacterized protein LOC107768190 [Nicotiana tabacum]